MSLQRVGFVALPPGREPGFDHADVWLGGGGMRMYVAHTGADRVEVIDCQARVFLRSLDGLPGVAGVLVDQEQELLFTSDRACARVSVFRCSNEALLGQVKVGPHPNGRAYDRARRRLYSFNLGEPPGAGCTASVVNLKTMSVIAASNRLGRRVAKPAIHGVKGLVEPKQPRQRAASTRHGLAAEGRISLDDAARPRDRQSGRQGPDAAAGR